MTSELGEANRIALIIQERKVRRFLTNFQHDAAANALLRFGCARFRFSRIILLLRERIQTENCQNEQNEKVGTHGFLKDYYDGVGESLLNSLKAVLARKQQTPDLFKSCYAKR
ncbi:MAG: hypothetical protein ONB44_10265 [candidate division KSB1 bacterium]|nr:hypothetical protein [candidate division KSB1 bacterium]MDZ7302508.1 hypothetical protein [candidate division KSB1 bacterium]MDZ7311896.1 hypothetical protein [candidate division KSB1 bacterium]